MGENENKTINPELNEAIKGLWDSLTDEQKEKAKACKSMEELAALAGKIGIELPDEMLDAVAGGAGFDGRQYINCPYCGAKVHFDYVELQGQPRKEIDGRRVYEFQCCRKFYAAVSVFDPSVGKAVEYFYDYKHEESIDPIKPRC